MDGYKDFQGKTLDDAIREACSYFDAPREKLEIDIVQDAKSGIFGLVGARKAKVRARRVQLKTTVEELVGRGRGTAAGKAAEVDAAPAAEGEPRRQREDSAESGKPSRRNERPAREKRDPQPARRNADDPASTEDAEASQGRAPRAERPRRDARPQREKRPESGEAVSPSAVEGGEVSQETGPDDGETRERTGRRRRRGGRGRGRSQNGAERSEQENVTPEEGEAAPRSAERTADRQASRATARPASRSASRPASPQAQRPSQRPTAPARPAGNGRHEDADAPGTLDDFADGVDDAAPEGLPEIPLAELDQDLVRSVALEVTSKLVTPVIGEAALSVELGEGRIKITVDCGDNSGLLIGREGQTLASIQYLASRIVARKLGAAVRVQLDTGDYRERQDEKLRELALALADKVRTSGKPQSTRPLSSYHRRVVHLALQEEEDIVTRSKGDGPLKRVIVLRRRKTPAA